mmetsp:Transcript_63440/g.175465  ORF Transcript_63440/g.175465 Transcript_63440/m.175465 type:complete len:171 (-) Transcript_63440:296-808(-)
MSSMQPLLLPVRASGREGGSAWACALIASGDDEARPRSAACVNHRLDDIADYSMAQRRGGAADLEFSHEEALECCAWMTPDLFARVAYRRRLDAAFDAYDEAPPSELSCLVYRLSGLEVQDDGLGAEEAHQPLPTPASVPELLGRRPPPGFGALCASSCEELYAKYSLHL